MELFLHRKMQKQGGAVDEKEAKKELAKLRRAAVELAAQVHDIVEERLWEDYAQLPSLGEQIVTAVKAVEAFKEAHGV